MACPHCNEWHNNSKEIGLRDVVKEGDWLNEYPGHVMESWNRIDAQSWMTGYTYQAVMSMLNNYTIEIRRDGGKYEQIRKV